jgi:uncharacterized membrane protein YoaK (UPF0700 family)
MQAAIETNIETKAPWLTREGPTAFILSSVSGFVDTAGFVLLFGLFTAHVTGNFVLAGAAIAGSRDGGVGGRLAMFLFFMAGVFASSLMASGLRNTGRSVLRPLLIVEAGLLAAFMLGGVVLSPQTAHNADAWQVIVVGGIGVLAMGIQNALMRDALPTYLPTTVMTGNFTMFTMDLLIQARSAGHTTSEERDKSAVRLRRLLPVMSGFLLGCAGGGISAALTNFYGIALPALLTAVLAAARPASSSDSI